MNARALVASVACVMSIGAHHQATQPAARVLGISFSIDTVVLTADARGDTAVLQLWKAFASFKGRVRFAGGRGRLDVESRRAGAPLVVDRAVVNVPLALPGEYYLFDSTSFTLVHPTTRSFHRFGITGDAYSFSIRRDG